MSVTVGVKLGVGERLGVSVGGTKAVQVAVGEWEGVAVMVGVNGDWVKRGSVGVQLGVNVGVGESRSGARWMAT